MSLNKPKVSSGKIISEKSVNTLWKVGDNSIKYDRPVTFRRMPSDPNFGKISSVSISPSTPAISTNPVVTVEYDNSDGDARLQHATQTSGVSYGMWNQTAGTTFSVGVGGVTGSGVVKIRTVYNAKVLDQGVVDFNLSFSGNGGRTVDRSPFFLVNFSAFSSNRDSYGVAGGTSGSRSDWLHTPAAGNISGQGNSAENGRLYFVQKQIIEQALNGRTFDRIMIGNPAGYVAGDIQGNVDQRQGYYPNNAGTGMLIDEARSYASSVTNPSIGGSTGIGILQTYATPFTPTGTPGETRGDQVAAWKVATDALRSANVKEVFCYIGYGQAYETSSKNTIDDNILGYSPGWSRSDAKPTVYPRDEWERQWNILRQCGFDNAAFDAGTYVAKYDDESDYKAGNSRINVISDVIGTDNQQFEAIPRDADGGMKTTNTGLKWDYTKTKSWAYWPILGGIEIGGELYGRRNAGTTGVINFTDWSLDLLTTEVHVVLDLYKLMNEGWINNSSTDTDTPNGRVIVWSEFKALVEALKSKGLIVSGSSWSESSIVNDEGGGVKTSDDVAGYILSSQSG